MGAWERLRAAGNTTPNKNGGKAGKPTPLTRKPPHNTHHGTPDLIRGAMRYTRQTFQTCKQAADIFRADLGRITRVLIGLGTLAAWLGSLVASDLEQPAHHRHRQRVRDNAQRDPADRP